MFVKNLFPVRMLLFFSFSPKLEMIFKSAVCLELAGGWGRASPGPSPLLSHETPRDLGAHTSHCPQDNCRIHTTPSFTLSMD